MQTINNLDQIKGGGTVYTVSERESGMVRAEILRLFEEDRASFIRLYGEGTITDNTAGDDVIFG